MPQSSVNMKNTFLPTTQSAGNATEPNAIKPAQMSVQREMNKTNKASERDGRVKLTQGAAARNIKKPAPAKAA